MPPGQFEGQAKSSLGARLEQGIGGGTMGQSAIAMRLNPPNFSFELGNTFVQFIVRIAIQALGDEQAGRIFAGTGAIIIVHGPSFQRGVLAVNLRWR